MVTVTPAGPVDGETDIDGAGKGAAWASFVAPAPSIASPRANGKVNGKKRGLGRPDFDAILIGLLQTSTD
jgi:hypothetical protein